MEEAAGTELAEAVEPVMKGRFSLYNTPDGGKHLSYIEDGDGKEAQHIELPGRLLKLMEMAKAGKMSPMGMLSAFREFF